MNQSRRLGGFLVDRKVLSRDALEVCLQKAATGAKPLPAVLVGMGLVSEKALVAAIADSVGRPFVDLADHLVPAELDRLLPADVAERFQAVAVDTRGDELVVAMADAGNKEAIEAIEAATGWRVQPALAVRSEVKRLLVGMYGASTRATPPPIVATEAGVDAPAHAGVEIDPLEIDLDAEAGSWRTSQGSWGEDPD